MYCQEKVIVRGYLIFKRSFLKIHDLKEQAGPFEIELNVFFLPSGVENME